MFNILFAFFTLTSQIEGGWESISVHSKEVNSVRSYLQKNIPILFPELENYEYLIESAKLQIVAGMNLQLNIQIMKPQFSFIITLYINPQKQITILDISPVNTARPILGEYVWHKVTNEINENLLKFVQGKIIVYRTKIERGVKIHVIFRDENQDIYSAVFARNHKTQKDELVFIYKIE